VAHNYYEYRVTSVKPNAPVAKIPVPDAVRAAVTPPARVESQKLAEGVWLLGGGTHNSLLVAFKDYTAVVDAPNNEARSLAVIAEAAKLAPGKPIQYVINTHHHFDHSSGLRTFVAEGVTIVTQGINKPYYEKFLAAPHTLNTQLSLKQRGTQRVKVETVEEKKIITDGNHTIELYHLQGNMHNAGILIAYLPKEKIVVQADMYAPPADPNGLSLPINTYTQNFLENLDRLKLDIGQVISIHYPADGRKITYVDMMRSLGKGNR